MYLNGRNAVLEAIRGGERIEKIYYLYGASGEALDQIRQEARRAGIPDTTIDRERFKRMERQAHLSTRSQGVLARIDPVDYVDVDRVAALAWERGENPLLVALDGITDPHNLGAIIRSAECSGAHGVLIPRRKNSGISDVVIRSSAGAVHHLPISRSEQLEVSLKDMKQSGLQIIGLDERGTETYTDIDWSEPSLILIGSEGDGITPRVAAECDRMISIPMAGSISSLNASVAAGVVLFEAARQRRAAAAMNKDQPNDRH